MNAKFWAIQTELSNVLPLSAVTLEMEQDQYRFHILDVVERVTHVVTFDPLEFDSSPLPQLLDLIVEHEVIKIIELAPVALEIGCRLAG
jgi:hypothetical protein